MQIVLLLLALTAISVFAVEENVKPAIKPPDPFAIPNYLAHDVEFWSKVYREWDIHQVVIYDSPTKLVYRVLNLPRLSSELSAPKFRKEVKAEKDRVKGIIEQILAGKQADKDSSKEFISIYETIKKHGLSNETDLAGRMRHQSGLRSQFELGIKISGRYAEEMKAVLRSFDIPEELIAMVYVESLFNIGTLSHAGATGPWGIMRATAISLGIHVNKFTDERIDPIVASLAAARYVKKARENLFEWSLIITSYNYGIPGLLRAVSTLGTKDFSVILREHKGGLFGYASKNYFAEVLAAIHILRDPEKYFPNVKKDKPWEYEVVQVQRPLLVEDMLSSGALSENDLAEFNPSLTRLTVAGAEVIPADYALRVPKGKSNQFYANIKRVPSSKRSAAGLKVSSKYHARGKESLQTIAKALGISAEFLSERMGKPLDYRPKGPVIIRSQAHLFYSLLEINKNILATVATGEALVKPPEISAQDKNALSP